ncbi:MAG: Ig-like domain-containing protein [Ruminococcus sp.]|nr:Ig-like domain-containing protein [Ruminococcus sp.]MDD5889301.1 Ig-like domain-containing protein [Ruminococcus sp.]
MKHNFRNSVVALLLVTITLLSSLTSVLADSISEDDNINYTNIINLVIGQSYVFNYDNDNITNCTSENTDVVCAINNGSIYAINYGTSDVTVTTTNTTYTYKVNVIRKKLVDTYVTILPTNSFKIELDNVFPDGVEKNNGLFPEPKYTFTSADESIASVSDDGIVTGKSEGETEIKVKFGSDKHILNLYVTVDFPYIDLKDMTINAGEKKRIDYTRGAYQKMNCYSSDPSVATIDNKACITGIKKGTSTINIIIGDLRCTATITVKNDPSLNITNKTIYTGNSFNLKVIGLVGNATFTSSNSKAATVNSNGKVTCKSAGNSNITVIANGVTLKCKVRVINPIIKYRTKIYIKNSTTISIRGKVGKSTFKSSNKKVATVNSKGKITGKKKGTCTIIIRTNGVTLKKRITVINPKLNKNSTKLVQGKTFKLKVYGGNGKVKYSSSNNRIATVSKYGNIRAKYAGSCKVTIIRNGIKLVCKVKVTASKYPVGLKYNFKQTKKNITRHMSETFNLSSYYKIDSNAKALYKSKKCSKKQYQNVKLTNLVKFKSSDNKVATVYANGKIKAKIKGNCTITVTLYNKKTYTYNLKIADKLTEKTLKNGKKVKYVYSYNELLNEIVNEGKEYNIKGLKSPYYGYACMFENKFVPVDLNFELKDGNTYNLEAEKLGKNYIKKDRCLFETLSFATEGYWSPYEFNINKCKEINAMVVLTRSKTKPLNDCYKSAMEILNSLKIDTLKSKNDRIASIVSYVYNNFTYSLKDSPTYNYLCSKKENNVTNVSSLLSKKGVCSDYSYCTAYLCYLSGTECYITISETENHQANVIKADNGKYYFCDSISNIIFYGKRQLSETVKIKVINEYEVYIKKFYNIKLLVDRSLPYMTEEDKKDFNSEVPTKEYLEWKYGDCDFKNGCTYLCDENVLKSLGIKPTN